MSYVAAHAENYEGQVVGEGRYQGQCAVFVQVAAGAPSTLVWKQGELVKGKTGLAKGTAIATFGSDGKYTNKSDGTAHGAIYISQSTTGIDVWDQWVGQPVHKRTIQFQSATTTVTHVNDGNYFYVIE